MTDYLCIKNSGEIDINSIILLGASTKRGDSKGKFGFFGTGASYAAAVLLRAGAEIIIYSGKTRIDISKKKLSFRDKEFNQIVLIKDGAEFPTSFTTELGPTWEVWMAVREFITNSKDEGGESFAVVDDKWVKDLESGKIGFEEFCDDRDGNTHILISYESVKNVWENWKAYFRFEDTPLETVDGIGSVYPHLPDGRGRIYKRGVLVYIYPEKEKTLYDYDLEGVSWNEDRRSNPYDISYPLFNLINQLSQSFRKEILLKMGNDTKEGSYASEYLEVDDSYGEIFKDKLVLTQSQLMLYEEEVRGKDYVILSDQWYGFVKKNKDIKTVDQIFGSCSNGGYKVVPITELETKYLQQAKKFFNGTGFDIDLSIIDIGVVKDKKLNTWAGMVDNDRVVINRDLFNRGLKEVVRCLVEEFCHLRSGECDKTRKFQNVLIDGLVNVIINKSKRAI